MTTAFTNGTVWRGSGHIPAELSVTVQNGRILTMGQDVTPPREVVDLDGAFLMPAFGDGHAHPMFALESQGPTVRGSSSVEEIVTAVAKYAPPTGRDRRR